MFFTTLALFTIFLTGSNLVKAHGMIKFVEVDGVTYPGAAGPGSDPSNSPIRAVSVGEPIDDVNSLDMLCGWNSQKAPLSAKVKPSDAIKIGWQGETGIDWFHNVGMSTYVLWMNEYMNE
jgi:Auxiliary Activity family 9 (formerly GH61)